MNRLTTAFILVAFLIGVVFWAPLPVFAGVVAVAIGLGLHEYFNLVLNKRDAVLRRIGLGAGLMAPLFFLVKMPNGPWLWLVAACFMVMTFVLFLRPPSRELPADLGKVFFGVVYVGGFLSSIIGLRTLPSGPYWVLLVFVITACTDTGAYFTGRTLGKHKLMPAVSPKKTVEGAVGGLIAALVCALIYRSLFLPTLSVKHAVIMSLGLSILGQLGDLIESMLKRAVGAKDSGTIFPGHGGLLDRLDSALVALPAAYLYITGVVRPG
ncbi:MAG: phosphatidate cytidylyltransferase [Deltaproteobacteria bacterium]|nr:phosphatidate cytidylyltransferase [Deltaproteobacteria bacterium]